MKKLVCILGWAALTLWGAIAQAGNAGLINVQFTGGDFGSAGPTYTGAAEIGSPGDSWNPEPAANIGTTQTLIQASGQLASGVTLSYTADGSFNGGNGGNPFSSTGLGGLFNAYNYVQSADGSAAFSGLTPGNYDLYLYAVPPSGFNQDRALTYAVGTSTGVIGPGNGASILTQGVNYVELQTTVGQNGQLLISYGKGAADEGDLNAIQLAPAAASPEPSSVILGGLGLAGLLIAVRRRHKA